MTVQSSTTELQSCSQYFYRTRKNWGDTSPSKRRSATMDSLKMGTSSLTLKIHLFIKTHFMTKMVKAVFCALILKREACLLRLPWLHTCINRLQNSRLEETNNHFCSAGFLQLISMYIIFASFIPCFQNHVKVWLSFEQIENYIGIVQRVIGLHMVAHGWIFTKL